MSKKGANKSYWGNIKDAIGSLANGLLLSVRHIWEAKDSRTPIGIEESNYFNQKTGIVTLQYPNESFPVPDNGRYRLHNEIEDCIVCDKCAKICPVNCIEIEPVRAIDEDLGKTSDGTPKRIYAAKFDIDMGKCCFCGLCTTVCPTECLTMTKAYDFSEFDVADHVYAFAEMTPLEILEKKQKLEVYNQEKAKALAEKKPTSAVGDETVAPKPKPSFKPRVQPVVKSEGPGKEEDGEDKASSAPKPVFKPKIKPVVKKEEDVSDKEESGEAKPAATASPKPVFRPKIKPVIKKDEGKGEDGEDKAGEEENKASFKPRPVFKPKIKPLVKQEEDIGDKEKTEENKPAGTGSPKPVFRPKIKQVVKKDEEKGEDGENKAGEKENKASSKPRPVFRPKIKPKKDDDSST